jgi:hypothetical protein
MNNKALKKKLALYGLTAGHRKWLVDLFVLFLWALIHYFLGNKFYSLYIIVFFLILILYRPPNFTLLAVSVLVIVLFSIPTTDTLSAVKQENLDVARNPKPTLTNIFSPNSRPEAKLGDDLQSKIWNMLSLLKEHDVDSYQLSDKLQSDAQISIYITVAAWPIKMERTSSYVLITIGERGNYPTCSKIDQKKDVALVYCH